MNTIDCFKAVKPFDINTYKKFIEQPYSRDNISMQTLASEIILRGAAMTMPEEMFMLNTAIIPPPKLRALRLAYQDIDRSPLAAWLNESMKPKPSTIYAIAASRGHFI